MLCESCSSTRVLAIKGQNYCLDCGWEVKGKSVTVASRVAVKPVSPVPVRKPSSKLGSLEGKDVQNLALTGLNLAFKRHLLWSGISADLLLGALILFPILLLSAFPISSAPFRQEPLLLGVALAWAFLALAVAGLRLYLSLAVTYGLSKQLDHRPQPVSRWHNAARMHFVKILWVRLSQLLSLLLLAVVESALLLGSGGLPVVGLRLPVVFIGTLIILAAAVAVIAAGALAKPAIVGDDFPADMSLRYGLLAFRRRTSPILTAVFIEFVTVALTGAVVAGVLFSFKYFWQFSAIVDLPLVAAGLIVTSLAIRFGTLFVGSQWLMIHQKLSRP